VVGGDMFVGMDWRKLWATLVDPREFMGGEDW
jgi:hypothetical protein